MPANQRPGAGEYGDYFGKYVKLVPDGDITDILRAQGEETALLLAELSSEQAEYRYEPDKWSLKEAIGHLADTERVMSFRLLCAARGETAPLPGFDQDRFVTNASFGDQPLLAVAEDYAAVRQATLCLLEGLPEAAWTRQIEANGEKVTARAFAYIIAGHEAHHLQVIQDRYLGGK
ncbi:DinB family protein [Paenibacillus aurantius]|uniref:DinB family protein n=1 Tax=Paenibacillus aurantius TaxID=2918900 RepID=A0AA96LF45_9BACL|nr:DinB family protein [Paenibacillus aurantius]WNQ10951.1 DinB family protein [Paenibacillus aurantius]